MRYQARTQRGSKIVAIIDIATGKTVGDRGTWNAARRAAAAMNDRVAR